MNICGCSQALSTDGWWGLIIPVRANECEWCNETVMMIHQHKAALVRACGNRERHLKDGGQPPGWWWPAASGQTLRARRKCSYRPGIERIAGTHKMTLPTINSNRHWNWCFRRALWQSPTILHLKETLLLNLMAMLTLVPETRCPRFCGERWFGIPQRQRPFKIKLSNHGKEPPWSVQHHTSRVDCSEHKLLTMCPNHWVGWSLKYTINRY